VEERPFWGRVSYHEALGFSPRWSICIDPEAIKMKFAKIIFWIATLWGILILTPLYFMFDTISRQDPPPLTHPAFYYGFVGVGLAWQFAFIVIARDPVRFRPMMIPSVLEKFSYGTALIVLYLQHRLHASDLVFGGTDLLLGILFLVAFFQTAP
jgi:vacuolar-type H+-ATPase subunit I/STV1